MTANMSMYKKSALIRMNMARDLFLTDIGERIPTILEYTEQFKVSRGIVQQALETLTNDGSVVIEKRGVLGSFLVEVDQKKLYKHTDWGSIMGTMPVPLNPYLTSIATAVCEEMNLAPVPFSFAYMSGSEKRVEALENRLFDFLILSRSAATRHMEGHDDLAICTVLDGSKYSAEYVLCFMGEGKTEIEDGMRVGVDPVCLDQRVLTEKLCQGKNVEFVEFPFLGFGDIIREGKVDCAVFRKIDWDEPADPLADVHMVPLEGIPGFGADETNTPVVMVRKGNYGMDRLLKKYLHADKIQAIQKQVLEGKRSMKFY